MSKSAGSKTQREFIRTAALDTRAIEVRAELAAFTAETYQTTGNGLHVAGHLLGPDRKSGASPFGHGDDAVVAVSSLLRIAAQLVSGSADLVASNRIYAGAALVRQLVEVEYLAWAFEANKPEAARWLRSTREERKSFFTPAKLRKAADGKFRGADYGYHCEMGGHPTPNSAILLTDDEAMGQLMLSDCLGHSGRIWDHIVTWSRGYHSAEIVASKAPEMLVRYTHWKTVDALTALPPPPLELLR